jgi:hypothetical protein
MQKEEISDVFRRKAFADSLLTLIGKVETPFCFGLDANWGNGKTTFVKEFLKPKAEVLELPVVIYDCFEQERSGEPFFTITQHILEQLKPKEKDKTEQSVAEFKVAAKSFAIGSGKVFLKALSKTILKQELTEVLREIAPEDLSSVAAEETTAKLEEYIADKLQDGLSNKEAQKSFHASVEDLAKKYPQNRIVVVIDELDRCRPKFALDVLESIKHLLCSPGLVFVITYHRDQLCGLIRHEFGQEIDADMYLHKFVNLDLILPVSGLNESSGNFETLCKQYFVRYGVNSKLGEAFTGYLDSLHDVYKFEARTIEKMVVLLSLTEGSAADLHVRVLLIIWSIKFYVIVKKYALGGTLSAEDRRTILFDEAFDKLNKRFHFRANFDDASFADALFGPESNSNRGYAGIVRNALQKIISIQS